MRLQGEHQEQNIKEKGDEMWAVQTGITVLRRRLKILVEQRENEKQILRENNEEAGASAAMDEDVFAMFNDGICNGGIGGDEDKHSSNSSMQINTAVLVEKQLLAVQMALLDEITDEKRKIAQLLSVLREVCFGGIK